MEIVPCPVILRQICGRFVYAYFVFVSSRAALIPLASLAGSSPECMPGRYGEITSWYVGSCFPQISLINADKNADLYLSEY
jgi:hypothetical protein